MWYNTSDTTLRNPEHVYETPGTYNVNLTIRNFSVTSTLSRMGYIIVVTPPVTPTPTPTATPTPEPTISPTPSPTPYQNRLQLRNPQFLLFLLLHLTRTDSNSEPTISPTPSPTPTPILPPPPDQLFQYHLAHGDGGGDDILPGLSTTPNPGARRPTRLPDRKCWWRFSNTPGYRDGEKYIRYHCHRQRNLNPYHQNSPNYPFPSINISTLHQHNSPLFPMCN